MPIYYDGSESREGTRLPKDVIEYGRSYPRLEQLTGADFIIFPEYSIADRAKSQKPLPIIANELNVTIPEIVKLRQKSSDDVLIEYALSGALLVQRKSGMDLLNSLGERMNGAIAKMIPNTYCNGQRILLYTGVYTEAKNGQLKLNGHTTNYKWWSFQCALDKFQDRGGVTTNLNSDSQILQWIKHREIHLKEYQHKDIKWIFSDVYYPPDLPFETDELQIPRKVSDARLILAQLPGMGPETVNSLWFYVQDVIGLGRVPTLLEVLQYATSYETAKNVKGYGKKRVTLNRRNIGLPDGHYLAMAQHNITIQKE